MNTDNPYNLDMESTEPQAMCSGRAGEEVLKETFRDYFGGLNYFFASEQAELTYSWYSAESKARVMHVWFKDGKLYACGVYNLGFPKM